MIKNVYLDFQCVRRLLEEMELREYMSADMMSQDNSESPWAMSMAAWDSHTHIHFSSCQC